MEYIINPCRFVICTQRKCLRILFAVSFCVCILIFSHFIYPNKAVTDNAPQINVHSLSSKNPSIQHDINSSSSKKGFIVVGKYFEQQTGAAINMLTLTKWAKSVGAFPVEPFVHESTFVNFDITNENEVESHLRFRDYFDIDLWNNKSLDVNAMPLVPYSTFLAQKPNSVIVVGFGLQDLPSPFYIDDEIMNLEAITREKFESRSKSLMQKFNMTIVRRVYSSFENHSPIHIHQFNKIIYGSFDPSSVVVWIYLWQGISKQFRVKIIEKEYHRSFEVFDMLQTSSRIKADSKKYAKRILKSNFGDFLAVSFRSVKRAKRFCVKNLKNKRAEFFKSCIQKLKHTIDAMNNTKRIFLALDIGRFGDNKAAKYLTRDLINSIEHDLLHILYNDTFTLKKWEAEFVKVTGGITDSGYIATMQSTLLENSGCLIMFGGDSNFQRNLLLNYQKKYSNPCIQEVCYVH